MKTGATFNRGGSNQIRSTPPNFIEAVEKRFGAIDWDLAANESNRVVEDYLGPGSAKSEDAFAVDFASFKHGILWCNPPFSDIGKFTDKIARECRDRIGLTLFLVPASVDANWFKTCEENGFVIILEDRITFVGEKDPFPKGLALIVFGYGLTGRARWHWDTTKTKAYERNARRSQEVAA